MNAQYEATPCRRRLPHSSSFSSSATCITPPSSSANSTRRLGSRSSNRRMSSSEVHVETYHEHVPTSSLLLDKLQQKKVTRQEDKHRSSIDDDQSRQIAMQSSRAANSATIGASGGRPWNTDGNSSNVLVQSKGGIGVKETEDKIVSLEKQNFNLKLEIHHRRKRQEKLEKQLDLANVQNLELYKLQAFNEKLVKELQQREQAIEEAVTIICLHEDRIKALTELRKERHTPYSEGDRSTPDSAFDHENEIPSSPPSLRTATPTERTGDLYRTKHYLSRIPSFLSDADNGADALRSLYLPSDDNESMSLPPLREDTDASSDESEQDLAPDSSNLSVLSKSSFPSLYGRHPASEGCLKLTTDSDQGQTFKDLPMTPSSETTSTLVRSLTPDVRRTIPATINRVCSPQFLSLNDVLQSPTHRLRKLERSLRRVSQARSPTTPQATCTPPLNSARRQVTNVMPPTPSTVSSSTIENHQVPRQDDSCAVPTMAKVPPVRALLTNDNLLAHRPSAETITSRREGHGWDTATEFSTEANSMMTEQQDEGHKEPLTVPSNGASLDSARLLAQHKQQNLQPPELLKFQNPKVEEGSPGAKSRRAAWEKPISIVGNIGPSKQSIDRQMYRQRRPRVHEESYLGGDSPRGSHGTQTRIKPFRSITSPVARDSIPQPPASNIKPPSLSSVSSAQTYQPRSSSLTQYPRREISSAQSDPSKQSAISRIHSKIPTRLLRHPRDNLVQLRLGSSGSSTLHSTGAHSPGPYSPGPYSPVLPSPSSPTSSMKSMSSPFASGSDQMFDSLVPNKMQRKASDGASTDTSEPTSPRVLERQASKVSMDVQSIDSVAPPPIPRWGKLNQPYRHASMTSRPLQSFVSQGYLDDMRKPPATAKSYTSNTTVPTKSILTPYIMKGFDVPSHYRDIEVGDGEEKLGIGVKAAAGARRGILGLPGAKEQKWYKKGNVIFGA